MIKFDRVTGYQYENLFNRLATMHMLELEDYLVFPKAVLLETSNTVHIITPKMTSLHEFIHYRDPMAMDAEDRLVNTLTPYFKLEIAF